jgi:ATP-dependent Zn protease
VCLSSRFISNSYYPGGRAADDMDKATDIARSMITRYGMHEKLGQMTYDELRSSLLGGVNGE